MQILDNNLIVFVVIVLMVVGTALGFLDVWRLKKRLKTFFNGSGAKDLEGLISKEISRVRNLEKAIKDLTEEYKKTQAISLKSLHRVGIVRFNPFQDTGGDQSFVIALLDSKNDGVILTNLYTREGNRTYAKPINGGNSRYELSKEEKQALEKAMKNF